MEAYGFNKDEARSFILNNKHNHITTTYYLMLKKNIKNGIASSADLCSNHFIDYLKHKKNLLASSNKDDNNDESDNVNIKKPNESVEKKNRYLIAYKL